MDRLTFLGNAEPSVIEGLYHQYLENPLGVESGWRSFFDGLHFARSYDGMGLAPSAGPTTSPIEIRVLNLINDYRMRGHLFTKTNPVRERRKHRPTLDLEHYGLTDDDLETVFEAGTTIGLGPTTLREIVDHLRVTYCRSIGVEFKDIQDPSCVAWFETRMESSRNIPNFSRAERLQILQHLLRAVTFEQFLHSRFVGQKRFSLEGAETLIPALNAVILRGAELGIEEFVFGMAHRGRLNVLTNVLGKQCDGIFSEFEGAGYADDTFDGDVKYHLGFSTDQMLPNGRRVHLSLPPNPSHLEAVDPVVEGIVRAKLDHYFQGDTNRIVPILIHGDASIAGQGVVYEVLQMSQLRGYGVGGTIHVVVNNQLGFTTHYLDGRSSTYCTDIAKVTRSPVFHVNADEAEAVVYTVHMALEYRQKFHRDVFIDLLGYRKHGHNEGDEPRFTQPLLYTLIEQHPNPLQIYQEKLIADGVVDAATVEQHEQQFIGELDASLDVAKQQGKSAVPVFLGRHWQGLSRPTEADFVRSPETGVPADVLRPLAEQMLAIPDEIPVFRKIRRLFEERRKMVQDGHALDWAMGEWLAYATLLADGVGVRISGQDCERGTFSHRHAVLTLEDSEAKYVPLQHISPTQGAFEIYNSHLSEYGVLGFELGYAMASPRRLVIWEAQFGDFANGAQIIIDQFLSCAETKWQRMNGLVLLLPHGHEGQGPEHSSARMERFLTLCANNNMQVVNCTTPANLFHVLRRQMIRNFRRPLVIFTPKSLLRHPQCVSPLDDFTRGGFRELIDDITVRPKDVKKVLLCTGKVYYDLAEAREKQARKDLAIVRLEQVYPLPREQLQAVIDRYPKAKAWVWVQEEPLNMGAWSFLLRTCDLRPLQVVARKASETPASGFAKQHQAQQAALVQQALA